MNTVPSQAMVLRDLGSRGLIPLDLSPLVPSRNPFGIVSFIVHAATRPVAVAGFVFRLRHALRHYGRPILEADTKGAFQYAVRIAAQAPDVNMMWIRGIRLVQSIAPLRSFPKPSTSEPSERFVDVFGVDAAARISEGQRLGSAASSACAHLLDAAERDLGADRLAQVVDGQLMDPFAFMADERIPAAVRKVLRDARYGQAAFLAIIEALFAGKPLDRRRAMEVADLSYRGHKANLRLIASMPGVVVSESVLPLDERLDLSELDAERQRASARFDELLANAIAAKGVPADAG